MASTAAQQCFAENLEFADFAVRSVTSFSCARHLFIVSETDPSATSEKDARTIDVEFELLGLQDCENVHRFVVCSSFFGIHIGMPPAQSCSNMTTEMNHPERPPRKTVVDRLSRVSRNLTTLEIQGGGTPCISRIPLPSSTATFYQNW